MRQLEVVAVSDDGTQVLLASAEDAARATHSIKIDNRLQAAIRGELDDSERRESELSPKEIQARLRAGESEEQIAKLAKVPVARVVRYAGPVISERDRIVEQARAAVLQRPRAPEASIPLGEMVEKRLSATAGMRFETVAWTARRRDDGAWIVVLTYVARGGARSALWLWQSAEQQLSSLNALATRLGAEDPPLSRRKRVASKPVAKPAATKRAAAKRTTAKRATAKRAVAKRAVAKRTTAKRAAPKRAAVKRPAAKRPAAKRTAVKRTAVKRTAVRRSPVKRTAVRRSPVKPDAVRPAVKPAPKPAAARAAERAATRARRPRRERPVVEPPMIEPAPRTNGRVAVPSWSDVLLGVQVPAAARGRRRS